MPWWSHGRACSRLLLTTVPGASACWRSHANSKVRERRSSLCAENFAERHKILTGIGAVAAAGAGYEIYEHEKKKYDERRQQGGRPPPGGARLWSSTVQAPYSWQQCLHNGTCYGPIRQQPVRRFKQESKHSSCSSTCSRSHSSRKSGRT